MKQHDFELEYASTWGELATLLESVEKPHARNRSRTPEHLPDLYRRVCHHYSLAQARSYSPRLIQQLHALTLRAHQILYGSRRAWMWSAVLFFISTFPNALRRDQRFLWLSVGLFLGPALSIGAICYYDAQFIYHLMDFDDVARFEDMYDPDRVALGRERDADSDFMMFGHYIHNNIGIGFRSYAGGVLLGIGTAFALLHNGVMIGGVAGYLTQRGYSETFWPFVSGHSALELTGICICGMAGLMLAHALFAPGRHGRGQALRLAAMRSMPLVIGAALMLFCAAFIEGFWSSSKSVPEEIKYVIGAASWVMLVLYFALMGRNRAD